MALIKTKIYIAGPMTGIEDLNYPAFNAAAAMLREQGYHVENPAEHNLPPGKEWHEYMRNAIPRLLMCDAVALLDGWTQSRGARLEIDIAERLGMGIYMPDCIAHYVPRHK